MCMTWLPAHAATSPNWPGTFWYPRLSTTGTFGTIEQSNYTSLLSQLALGLTVPLVPQITSIDAGHPWAHVAQRRFGDSPSTVATSTCSHTGSRGEGLQGAAGPERSQRCYGIPRLSLGAIKQQPVTNPSSWRDAVTQGRCPCSPLGCPRSDGKGLADAEMRDELHTLMVLINTHSREMNVTRVHRDVHSLRKSSSGGLQLRENQGKAKGSRPLSKRTTRRIQHAKAKNNCCAVRKYKNSLAAPCPFPFSHAFPAALSLFAWVAMGRPRSEPCATAQALRSRTYPGLAAPKPLTQAFSLSF